MWSAFTTADILKHWSTEKKLSRSPVLQKQPIVLWILVIQALTLKTLHRVWQKTWIICRLTMDYNNSSVYCCRSLKVEIKWQKKNEPWTLYSFHGELYGELLQKNNVIPAARQPDRKLFKVYCLIISQISKPSSLGTTHAQTVSRGAPPGSPQTCLLFLMLPGQQTASWQQCLIATDWL